LKNVQKVVIDGAKKIIIELSNGVIKIITEGQTATSEDNSYSFDDTHHTSYVVIDNASAYAIKDVWAKVKQSVADLGDKLKASTKALIEKYKPKIINSLNKVKQFVIDEGQKIILEFKGDLVRIIQSATDNLESTMAKRSISDIWGKVKAAAKNLGRNIKDTVDGVLEQYKPKVINALSNVKKVVINGAKQIVIEINNGIVKIVTEGQTGSSDGAAFYYLDDDVHHDIYVEIDDASPAPYYIADPWTLVKSAVSDLGNNIKDRVMKVIEQYKPKVINALNNVKKVVINGAKQIVIEINNGIVKIVTEGQTASSDGAAFYYLDDDVHHDIYVEIDDVSPAAYGIKDVWNKVKSAVNNLGDNIKGSVLKVVEQHKPQVIAALKNLQRVIIDAGKKIIIEIIVDLNGAIVKVLVDGLEGLSV